MSAESAEFFEQRVWERFVANLYRCMAMGDYR